MFCSARTRPSRWRCSFAAGTNTAKARASLVEGRTPLSDLSIDASRRMSPPLLSDLLRFTGDQVTAYVRGPGPDAPSDAVRGAGPGPAPAWPHIGREYTE